MKDDAVIKDNEAVYLLNEQTYLHLRENLEGVGYEVFEKNSPLPVEEGQIPREVLGNTQRRIETARAYYLAEHQDEPVGRIQNVAVTTLEKFRSGVRRRRNLAPRSLPENDVRFIDPMYNELFRVPDGGVVQMTYPDGHQRSEVVEYLDDYHMKIGSSVQHICEFAERMARSRAIVEPEPLTQQDCRAWNLEYDYYLTVQAEDGAWNYALYQGDCCLLERGKIDAPELMIEEVRDEILYSHNLRNKDCIPLTQEEFAQKLADRNGIQSYRIIRQGNMNKEVKVFNYVTEGTFDSYLFQTLENKQRFISQIMTSKSPVRSCEDVDEQALSYAEIKALCAGNPLIKEKMDLDVQVAKLKVLKADHQSQKFRLQDKLLTKFPADIQEMNAHIAGLKADAQLAAAHPQGKEEFCGMVIKGVTYGEKKTAGERLVLACSELPNAEEKVIGSYRGFELSLRFDAFRTEYQALLKGQRKYTVPLGTDPLGNIIRLDNSLNSFPERITAAENELTTLHQQQAAAQIEVKKPFPQEEELAEKSARLAELNAQLDVDEKSHEPEQDEEEQEDAPRRPSVLAALEEKSDKPEPAKPFRSYYDKDGDAR